MQQAKGLVKFFLVLLLVICAGQFVYYFPTNRVEKDADTYGYAKAGLAKQEDYNAVFREARSKYLDSMSSVVVLEPFNGIFGKYTYQQCKSKQLALGLDLKGGMSVLLQVNLKDFIRGMSGNSADANFAKAIETATKRQQESQGNFVAIFTEEYRKAAGDGKMAAMFADNEALKSLGITYSSSDAAVESALRAKANETVKETYKLLQLRIDKMGVVQPNISLDAARDIIVVELPGIDNPQRAREFLVGTAKLEFWETYRNSDPGVLDGFVAADAALKAAAENRSLDDVQKDTSAIGRGPLLSALQLNATSPEQGGMAPVTIGIAEKNKRALISELLKQDVVRTKFPADLVFAWSKDEIEGNDGKKTGLYELHALRKTAGKDGAAIEGDVVTNASPQVPQGGGRWTVSLAMNPTGSAAWGNLTTRYAQDNKRSVAVVLDSAVVSAPSVNEPIMGGNTQISGNFDAQSAGDLAGILQIGKLPAKPEIIQESTVGPSLGAENIRNSIMALAISFLSILLFMSIYYSTGGLISIVALFINLFFIIGALTSYGTVLTLPGIAGIVLTMGMAVDANVIIYERIREELAEGKSTANAITEGFKHSMSAVVDGHLTAFITSLVLIWQGIGPIKGFGVVLAIGVIFTLFTAIFVSRLIVDWAMAKGYNIRFFAEFSQGAFKGINWDWMKLRKKAYIFSAALIVAGIVSMIVRKPAFEFGVDFTGGYKFEVAFDNKVDADKLRSELTAAFNNESTVVKAVNSDNTFDITTSYLSKETGDDVQERVIQKLHEGITKVTGSNLDYAKFKNHDASTTHIKSSSKVGPTVADDIRKSSIWTTLLGVLAIGLYIFVRFNRWQYSLGVVIAALHDALLTVALFTLLHGFVPWSMEINQDFIAALLTIVGYSINDTVIVYDRIREYMRKYTNKPMAEVINEAINSTLSRTIITSLTVLMVTLILFLVGGAGIKGFAFALFVGLLAGTYSSIFIAAPVMMDFSRNLDLSEYKPENTEGGKKTLKEKV